VEFERFKVSPDVIHPRTPDVILLAEALNRTWFAWFRDRSINRRWEGRLSILH